ncbi:MAG: MerR family transcriptional regulator [Armatimonadota bacterium]|nr:MerR family transcriptional regulator [Armatimonadota bacterium]
MTDREPVYAISVAARLCSVHPQTLRAYERQGLVTPARLNEKNRMFSEADVRRVKQIQRLTQELGVNLAGVEVILRLLDQMEDMRQDLEAQLIEYVRSAEERLGHLTRESKAPVPRGEALLPTPKLTFRRNFDL